MEKGISELVFNMMCDLKKQDIEPIAKAKLIQTYMAENGLTGRQLAKLLGIPPSTLQDWTRWNRISQEEYDSYLGQGFTKKDIYRSLRGGTLEGKTAIDGVLQNCINKLEVFKLMPPYSKETKLLLGKLKRVIKAIERQVK